MSAMCGSEPMKKRRIDCFSSKKFKHQQKLKEIHQNCNPYNCVNNMPKSNHLMQRPVYHEKQVKELCALHALNNLFQCANSFSKVLLDEICHSLSPDVWINPHKSLLGLGNYDINVIMKALQFKNYEAIWFDKRKDPSTLDLNNVFGFILNVPTDYKLGFVFLPIKRRHWIAIREINGFFYNLDSKLDSPQLIGKDNELITYLREQLECRDKELFIVVTSEVEHSQNWHLPGTHYEHLSSASDRDAEIVKLGDIKQVCDGGGGGKQYNNLLESNNDLSPIMNVEINPLCYRTHHDSQDSISMQQD